MADIIKVKAKKEYEWGQDKKFIYVKIPVSANTSLKKIDIYTSDLILRVTNLEKKQTHFLDLLHQIDYKSPENKFLITDNVLHATLKKTSIDQEWESLLVNNISLAELKIRRQQSELRHEQSVKSIQDTKQKLRVDYDRKATQEMMRFEQEERQKLQYRKKVEKEAAIREVFSNVNEKTGHFQKPTTLELPREETKWSQKQQIAMKMLQEQEQRQKANQEEFRKQKNQQKLIEQVSRKLQKEQPQNSTMFSNQDIDRYQKMRQELQEQVEMEQIPIRKAATQKVSFTERIHKNLAAREQFYKEPPMPKSSGSKGTDGDIQSKNPLWLKDRADSFFKDKNYSSAIQAYTEAIKIDSKLLSAYLNRSLAYMKTFKFMESIIDCQQALLILQSQISGDETQQIQSRLTLAKIKTRKGICLSWKGQLAEAKNIFKEVLEMDIPQDIKSQVENCLIQIARRQQSIIHKSRGDQLVKVSNHRLAIDFYNKSIEVDNNQYAISNKVLCLNKIRAFDQSCQEAQKGIKKVSAFNPSLNNQSREDKMATLILLKLYYRKARALQEIGSNIEAEQNVRKGLTINPEDRDLQDFLKSLKKKKNKEQIKIMKQQAVSLIKQSQIVQALQIYSKCLKLLSQSEDIAEYLAILQNQCVCFQKTDKYDDVLSTCIRIMKLVNRLQSKVLEFGGKKEQMIPKQELKKISVRTLVRRANAYIKTNQYYNAKADLEKALEISPEDSIQKELDNLKIKLQS